MASMDRPRLGSNVFILGAGASVHAGIPLLPDFIGRARSLLMAEGSALHYHQEIKTALAWIDTLRSAAYYVDLNVDNLEHVFSLAQLAKEAGEGGAADICESLRLLILETIDESCALKWGKEPERAQPDRLYTMFFRKLLEEVGGRRSHREVEPDPIITFNYDVLLDNAMFMQAIRPDYGLGDWSRGPESSWPPWPLYKLHGSLNWATHGECSAEDGKQLELLKPVPLPQGLGEMPRGGADAVPLRIATRNMLQTPCPGCGKKGVRAPAVMPPTWSKNPSEWGIGNAWERAVEGIRKATQIIIIGYSLPKTDTFFPYLLALGLQKNSGLRRVLVVNPADDSGATQQRYERAFARGRTERGFLEYRPITFETFVHDEENLQRVLHFADVPSRP